MPNRIHPLNPSVNAGRVHAPGTGHVDRPHGPQGPSTTHPKTLERIGPLAPLMGRSTRPAKEADMRPRAELPSQRDSGSSRSWMSSMKQAANKTGYAISHGFNRAGHALHKFGQVLNEPNGDPAWMRNMSSAERAHYDYYGEVPGESSHAAHSPYVAPPWERPAPSVQSHQTPHSRVTAESPQPSYVAAPWERPQRVEVRQRPMTDREQAAENEEARYHGHVPRSTVDEHVTRPASATPSRVSPGAVRTRPMTPAEQADEIAAARYHGVEPRTTIEEFVAARPATAPRPSRGNREALLNNIRETVPRMNLNRLDHAEPRDFVRFAQTLTKGTPYEGVMDDLVRGNPALGDSMKRNWGALRQQLDTQRRQGAENVPTLEWLFENRPSRMMAFLVENRDGAKLVRPTTQR
jgi:hypothetical protein